PNADSWCKKVETISTTKTCPTGYSSLNTTTCYQNNATYSVGSCPSGFALNSSTGNCERTLTQAVTYSCASGWTLSGTSCKRTLTQAVTYSCASGWTLSGTSCKRTLTTAVTYSCSSTGGWTLS